MYQNLEQEVVTRNSLNKKIGEVRNLMAKALKPYIGKKVIKYTPCVGWTAAVRKMLDDIEMDNMERTYRLNYTFHRHSVWLNLDTHYNLEKCGCKYVDAILPLVDIDGDILQEVHCDECKLRTDYTADEIRKGVERLKKLADEQSEIKSAIREFDSFFRYIR